MVDDRGVMGCFIMASTSFSGRDAYVIGLSILGLLSWAIIAWTFLWPVGLLLFGRGSATVLMLIAMALSHNQLGPIIKGATGIILLVGLFLDLLSS
jgi:hypothetical protein